MQCRCSLHFPRRGDACKQPASQGTWSVRANAEHLSILPLAHLFHHYVTHPRLCSVLTLPALLNHSTPPSQVMPVVPEPVPSPLPPPPTEVTDAARLPWPPEIWLRVATFLPIDTINSLHSVNRTFFNLVMQNRWKCVVVSTIEANTSLKSYARLLRLAYVRPLALLYHDLMSVRAFG